jgi:hypothetical protein
LIGLQGLAPWSSWENRWFPTFPMKIFPTKPNLWINPFHFWKLGFCLNFMDLWTTLIGGIPLGKTRRTAPKCTSLFLFCKPTKSWRFFLLWCFSSVCLAKKTLGEKLNDMRPPKNYSI